MSWDAWLHVEVDGHAIQVFDVNFTHNCNRMIEAVLDDDELAATAEPFWIRLRQRGMGTRSWWQLLDGLGGTSGAQLLARIIDGLEADPDGFRAMNPPNGWGNYDQLLGVLREMQDVAIKWPSGTWSVHG